MAFSGHQLIPHLAILQSQFLSPLEEGPDERFRSAYFDLELLPYSLGAACHSLYELARMHRDRVAHNTAPTIRETAVVVLTPHERDQLSFMADTFLDAVRRSQDAAIHYLSRSFSLSLPSSMSDLVKKLRKGQLPVPAVLRQEILKYWDTHGQRLKDYRDLSQHHTLVTSDARLPRSSDGRVGIYLLLPSNPEVKSAGKLTFGNPEIHVLLYVRREFKVLVAFLTWLTRELITPPPAQRRQTRLTVFRDPLSFGATTPPRAVIPPTTEMLDAEIRKLHGDLLANGNAAA